MRTGNEIYKLINMEVTTRTGTGNNTHEEDGRLQYVVTDMDSFDLVSPQVVYRRADRYGLDRWVWMRWETIDKTIARIVSAYSPVFSQVVLENYLSETPAIFCDKPRMNTETQRRPPG